MPIVEGVTGRTRGVHKILMRYLKVFLDSGGRECYSNVVRYLINAANVRRGTVFGKWRRNHLRN